jgi:hypothetical protein
MTTSESKKAENMGFLLQAGYVVALVGFLGYLAMSFASKFNLVALWPK